MASDLDGLPGVQARIYLLKMDDLFILKAANLGGVVDAFC
jgi:hypothetical protein